MTDLRWPDFFVVGAPRAGTTFLWSALDQHPQVFMSPVKEPHFFCRCKPQWLRTVSEEADYLRLFGAARAGQLRGEATPSYLGDRTAPGAIARVRPDARIVTVLREPVSRAYSEYWHRVRYSRQSRPFDEVMREGLAAPLERTLGSMHLRSGLYAEALERYVGAFHGRVLVLFQEELAADTRAQLRRMFGFLGVDAAIADTVQIGARNATALPRNALARRAYGSPGLRSIGLRVLPNAVQPRLERLLLRRTSVPPIDPELRRLLEAFYEPEAAALERMLGRPVPWASASSPPASVRD